MAITLGGYVCIDPRFLHKQCLETGMPVANWFNRANRFLHPRGREFGTGTFLLTRDALDHIDINGRHDAVFDDDTPTGKVTLKRISIASPPVCVTPGLRGDGASVYVVEVCDTRARLAKIPIDFGYNIRPVDGGDYLPETLDGTDPWTWTTLAGDLEAELGISPGSFPFTPAGTPENLSFYSSFAWDALNTVAALCGMALIYDITADTWRYVELGAADDAFDKALTAEDGRRVWDIDAKLPTFCRIPEKVRVRFARFPPPDDGSSPWYYIEKDPPGSQTTIESSVVWLDGGMDALGATGTPTNDADLQTRATEVAAKYYQTLLTGTDPLLRRYSGIRSTPALMPGKRVQAIAWLDVGGGYLTEVYRGPIAGPPPQPLPQSIGSSSGVKILRPVLIHDIGGEVVGNDFITASDGKRWYLCWVQDISLTDDTACPKASPDSTLAWLTSWYTEYISGYCGINQGFQTAGNKVYGGIPTGQGPLTLTADTGGGPPSIVSITDAGGGDALVTLIAAPGPPTASITLSGTTGYDGVYDFGTDWDEVDSSHFLLLGAYAAPSSGGTWAMTEGVTPTNLYLSISAPAYWSPHQDQGFICDASGIPVIGPGTGT